MNCITKGPQLLACGAEQREELSRLERGGVALKSDSARPVLHKALFPVLRTVSSSPRGCIVLICPSARSQEIKHREQKRDRTSPVLHFTMVVHSDRVVPSPGLRYVLINNS